MADILAIHWERKRLRVVEASVGSVLRVTQAFTIEIPELTGAGWLRDALKKNSVSAKQAVVSLPREDVILRQLELPDVPDDELPMLVSFQASARSATSLDQLVLDYIPLPKPFGSVQRNVLLASAPRTTVDPIRAALAEAGIELTSISVGSFALSELVARVEATMGHPEPWRSLLVVQEPSRLELVLNGAKQALATHLVRPPLNEGGQPDCTKASADISRTLVPASPWMNNGRLDRIWLLGDEAGWSGLAAELGKRWECPVESFDGRIASMLQGGDSTKVSNLASYAHALGLALTRSHRLSPEFDLLHPHQPKPKQNPRKFWLAVGSAAALVIVAAGTSVTQLTMASLESSLQKLKNNEKELDKTLKAGQPRFDAAKLIGDWSARDINQLQHFKKLNDFMNGTERLYVSDYRFDVTTGASNDVVAKVAASGNARERNDWQQVAQLLVDSGQYKSRPKELATSKNDPDYATRFELDADLLPPPKADAKGPREKSSSGGSKSDLKADSPSSETKKNVKTSSQSASQKKDK